MYSTAHHWGFNEDGQFGHNARHNIGDRDVDICRPDTDNSSTCCGCVRKGQYPCEYQNIGGEPPPVIEKCFSDPADWDDDGTVCLSESDRGCCPRPNFVEGNGEVTRWSSGTTQAIQAAGQTPVSKETWWSSEPEDKKGTCVPSVEGGMCKYTTDGGLTLFYNYVDGEYRDADGQEINTVTEREQGRNVKKLLNYPMLIAEMTGRNPPSYTNLCDRDNWDEANILFHQMTTEAGQNYYVDDYRERRRNQRLDRISRTRGVRDENGVLQSTGTEMSAESLLGDDAMRDRFGGSLHSPFGRGGSFFDSPQFRPQWNRDPEDNSNMYDSEQEVSLEETETVSVMYGFTVPDNVNSGDRIRVRIPTGALVEFVIPDTASSGSNIKFRVNR